MKISSFDVERRTFDVVRRGGFDRAQVSEFLESVGKLLSTLESELSVSRRHSSELEHRLGRAESKADESSRSFLFAADLKQRLLSAAEVRATEILAKAHTQTGAEDPATVAAEDLDLVRRRSGIDADGEDAEAVSSSRPGGDETASARTEAAKILAAAQQQADAMIAEAHQRSDEVRAAAEEVMAGAEGTVEDARQEALGQVQATSDEMMEQTRAAADSISATTEEELTQRVAEVSAAADRIMAAAESEAAQAVEVAGRRLAEAQAEADRVSESAASASEEVMAAAQEARREATELRAIAEVAQLAAAEDREAARTARDRADSDGVEVERLQVEVRRNLTEAEEKLAAAEAESERLVSAAQAESARERKAARERSVATYEAAEAESEDIVAAARTEAGAMIGRAGAEVQELLESSRTRQKNALLKLGALDAMVAGLERRADSAARGDDGGDNIVIDLRKARVAAQEIGAIVRDAVDSPDDDDESGAMQQSRYKRQFAGLPHLGDEATTNVLTDMGSLRTAEEGKSRRRRPPKA